MEIERVYIATHKSDVRLARICVASIRYWYPDIPIYLIKDYFNGEFSTEEMEHVWNVKVHETGRRFFGWGMSKLEPVFTVNGKRFLILDADTVFAGRVLDSLNRIPGDFVVHFEQQPESRLKEIYFDLDQLRKSDPSFEYHGQTFNTGQYVATGGLLKREDFSAVDWTTIPPALKHRKIFKNGEQGVLNYVLLKKASAGEVTIASLPFMRWPMHGMDDIDLKVLEADSNYPWVIHWAGLVRRKMSEMIRFDILEFFEDYYYSRVSHAYAKRRLRDAASFLSVVENKIKRQIGKNAFVNSSTAHNQL